MQEWKGPMVRDESGVWELLRSLPVMGVLCIPPLSSSILPLLPRTLSSLISVTSLAKTQPLGSSLLLSLK